MKPSLGFIGAGRAASALAVRFYEIGYPISGIYSRTGESAQKLAALVHTDALTVFPKADILIIAVPDDAISYVAGQLVNAATVQSRAVIHLSGVHDSRLLQSLHTEQTQIGSLHPLYPFRENTHLNGTEEMFIAIEASNHWLEATLVHMATDIGGKPAILKSGQKATYHAAAVIASNYLVTLFAVSLRLMLQAGIPPELAQPALTQLMQGNLNNLSHLLPEQALTGPIVRGDVATIRQHLVALSTTPYEKLYRELGRLTAELAPAHTTSVMNLFNEQG